MVLRVQKRGICLRPVRICLERRQSCSTQQVENLFGAEAVVSPMIGEAKGLEFNDGIVWNLVSRLTKLDGDAEVKQAAYLFKFLRDLVASNPGGLGGPVLEQQIEDLEEKAGLAKVVRSISAQTTNYSDLFNTRMKEFIVAVTRIKKRLIFYEEDFNSPAVKAFQALFFHAPNCGVVVSKRAREQQARAVGGSSMGAAAGGGSAGGGLSVARPLVSCVDTERTLASSGPVRDFPRQSNRAEYLKRAHEFFLNEDFGNAEKLYRIGGDEEKAQWAKVSSIALAATRRRPSGRR